MNAAELIALAERVEAATPQQQKALIMEAWQAVNPNYADPRGALAMLDVEAFESAAMTLVPKPGKWSITANGDADTWEAFAWVVGTGRVSWIKAVTPALALTAAALRARAAQVQP